MPFTHSLQYQQDIQHQVKQVKFLFSGVKFSFAGGNHPSYMQAPKEEIIKCLSDAPIIRITQIFLFVTGHL